MKKIYVFLIMLIALFATNLSVAQNSVAFLFEADSSSITNNRCVIDTPYTNGKDMVYPVFVHNYNPGGASNGIYVNKNLGMYYHDNTWRLFNQDLTPFVLNSAYNVLVPSSDMISWEHTAALGNITLNRTEIDHPACNGDSNAVIIVSHMWKGEYTQENIGVYYNQSSNKWNIFFQSGTGTPMVKDLKFNVVIAKQMPNYESAQVKATVSNTSNHIMQLDHPDLNYNPDAFVFITQNWNPGGGSGTYNDHPVGVYYNGAKWCIYNEDLAAISPGAGFNLIIFHNKNIAIKESEQTLNDLKVFPNPVASLSTLNLNFEHAKEGSITVRIYDLSGKCVLNEDLENNWSDQLSVDIPLLKRGVYVLQVESEGKLANQKLFIE